MEVLKLTGRTENLFVNDLASHEHELTEVVSKRSFFVLGGAGSIVQIVVKRIQQKNLGS